MENSQEENQENQGLLEPEVVENETQEEETLDEEKAKLVELAQEDIKKNLNVFEVSNENMKSLEDIEKKSIFELTKGFEQTFVPTLEIVKAQLELISKAQKELIASTVDSTIEMNDIPNFEEISKILDQMPMYIQKAKQVSRKMKSIDEKVQTLKKKTEKAKTVKK
jgi:predicted transcriptional regulator